MNTLGISNSTDNLRCEMKYLVKSKTLVSIILSTAVIFGSVPISATSPPITPQVAEPTDPVYPTPAEHTRIIRQFINEIRTIQSQVYDIAQFAQVNPPEFEQRLRNTIGVINRRIEELNSNISDYLGTVALIGDQNVQVLLLLNSLNLVKNGLYSLSVLTTTSPNILRIRLLDEYFRARIAGIDTLNTLEFLLEN
ncbi:MAG: hypothetical protein K0S71_306 [Clostridia bacterium]|jgi:hypothetical protein|nr:hypothetical protein [Clostridia bacterium]